MICFDTQMLIWGVQGASRPEQVGMIEKAKRYIAHLVANKEDVLIPTPVVCEYLIRFDPEEHKKHLTILERQFILAPFDLHAASVAAELHANREGMKELRKQHNVSAQSFKVDVMVVAVALARKARAIVSMDAHFPKLAGGRIPIIDTLPDLKQQGNLFDQPSEDLTGQ